MVLISVGTANSLTRSCTRSYKSGHRAVRLSRQEKVNSSPVQKNGTIGHAGRSMQGMAIGFRKERPGGLKAFERIGRHLITVILFSPIPDG